MSNEHDTYDGPSIPPEGDDDLLAGIVTGDALDAMEFPPVAWAVPGIIPEGYGLITGASKAGKSWLVFGLALDVARGTAAFGCIPTGRPRPVLYLALEDGLRRLQGRARKLLGEGVPIPPGLDVMTEVPHGKARSVIRAWLGRHRGQDAVVIVDVLAKVMDPAAPGEGAYERDYRVGSRFKQIVAHHPGVTLIAVHHTRKMAANDWADSTSGTTGVNGAADWTLNLSRDRNSEAATLRVMGRDVPEGEYAATVREGTWTLDGGDLSQAAQRAQEVHQQEGLGDKSAQVLRIVGEHPDGIGPTELGRLADLTASNAGTYLTRLADAGRIAKAGRGKYSPLSTVESVESVETAEPAEDPSLIQGLVEGVNNPPLSTVSTLSTQTCPTCNRAMGKREAEQGVCFQCDRIATATARAQSA